MSTEIPEQETNTVEDVHVADFPEENVEDISISQDWQRPRPLNIVLKDPNLVPHWIRTDRLDNARQQGWIVTPRNMVKFQGQNPVNVASQDNAMVKYGNLILHHMTKARAEALRRYNLKRADKQAGMVEQGLRDAVGKEAGVYGKIESRK